MTRFGITYSSFRSSASGTGIPRGVIAGIVVGIFLGVVAFPILGFILWRRRRRKGSEGDFTFIEPSIHKGVDITDVLDIQPGGLGQRRRPPAQSPVSEVSLDFFPVSIPQSAYSQSEPSPPTFPRSPTISSPSPSQHLCDISGRGVVHSPEAVDQYLGIYIRSPPQADLENTPLPGLNRRSSVPKPAGPRPQFHRASTDDPRTSVLIPPVQTATDSSRTNDKDPAKPSEPKIQQMNERGKMTIYSFLDMGSTSELPSTMGSTGRSRNSIQPPPHTNLDSPRCSFITGTNSSQSHRDSNKRRESGNSNPLSLSAVIQRPPTSELPSATGLHPYSPYPTTLPRTRQSQGRPRTGGASPTESIPITTSEVSEIRFCNPGEGSEPGAPLQSPPLNATPTTSPIYQKLFGTLRGEVPPDGLLTKKRPLHRKALSTPTFSTSYRV